MDNLWRSWDQGTQPSWTSLSCSEVFNTSGPLRRIRVKSNVLQFRRCWWRKREWHSYFVDCLFTMVVIFRALCGSVLNHVEPQLRSFDFFLLTQVNVFVPPIQLNKVNSLLVLSMWKCHLKIPWKQGFLTDTFHTLAPCDEYDMLLSDDELKLSHFWSD